LAGKMNFFIKGRLILLASSCTELELYYYIKLGTDNFRFNFLGEPKDEKEMLDSCFFGIEDKFSYL